MFKRAVTGAVLALSLVVVPNAIAASKHYYLALGDSLSVGYQPVGPNFAGIETSQGYTNDLQSHYAKQIRHLKLVEVGCPGATTTSLLTGHGNAASVSAFHCDQRGGSQLTAAVKFLKAHHHSGEVPLITIDIGANDVVPCAGQPFASIIPCVEAGDTAIKTNTPKILKALHKAAPEGTKFMAMNLYDPLLADELSSNSSTQAIGYLSLTLVKDVNGSIDTANKRGKFKTVNVAKAFDTYDTTPEAFDGGQAPTNVVKICTLTWMCAASPQGPNIHARPDGYKVIARAFEKVIGKLK
jgi:lysophospholipase L1-like esterase